LLATVTDVGMAPWDELHLFSAPSLNAEWRAHPRNPVVADARRSRPAGRVLRIGDRLVRPGQDCSRSYGRRIVLSSITTLTETEYEERVIGTIEPTGQPGVTRTHCYTTDGDVEVLDGFERVARWSRRRPSSSGPA
ncbi:MAG TPA: hypothetical protein VFI28_00745, partial [Candidatus Limnocylindrales bacterium]|nr:hypothetical protein [Candidatus Limnocylindrales bacterium]